MDTMLVNEWRVAMRDVTPPPKVSVYLEVLLSLFGLLRSPLALLGEKAETEPRLGLPT